MGQIRQDARIKGMGTGEPQPLPYPTRGRVVGWGYKKGIGRAILLLLVTVGEYVP